MRVNGKGMAWANVAHLLAERLSHNDACPDAHDPPLPDECPFCADMDAMRIYREKCGLRPQSRHPAENCVDSDCPAHGTGDRSK